MSVTLLSFILTAFIIFAILFIQVVLKLSKFTAKINGNYCLKSTARAGKHTHSLTQGCYTSVRATLIPVLNNAIYRYSDDRFFPTQFKYLCLTKCKVMAFNLLSQLNYYINMVTVNFVKVCEYFPRRK